VRVKGFAPLRALLAFAWRIWLWRSIGFVAANIALFAILLGSPSHPDWVALSLGVLVVLGPLLASASGVIFRSGAWVLFGVEAQDDRWCPAV